MTFGSLLPLIMLVGVPIIIILYMMKPKGKRKVIPSLLLWKDAERNDESVKFARKLIKNILMFLEIAALLLLMFAAMSPKLKLGEATHESTAIVIDVSGSMQFKGQNGHTRFEDAIGDARDFIELASGEVSVLAVGEDVEILANSITDKSRLRRAISSITPTDVAGDITSARGILEGLEVKNIIVYTDTNGASKLEQMAADLEMDIRVYGEDSVNVGLTQMSMKKNAEGLYDISIGYQKTGSADAQFDISLYDADGTLLEVRTINTVSNPGNSVLMLGKPVKGAYARAEISGISFSDDKLVDGLDRDNTAYSVNLAKTEYTAYLVGVGNTYYEKAYTAVTHDTVIKVTSDSEIPSSDKGSKVAIYDRADLVQENMNAFIQAYHPKEAEEVKGAIVTVKTGSLINDMSDFTFGAGNLSVLECPDWATPLMVVDTGDGKEKVVAYYGDNEGVKQVVLGFDIRDSEYPLMAEFPIFIADSLSYLTDESIVRNEYMFAGEGLALSPSVSSSVKIDSFEGCGSYATDPGIGSIVRYSGLYKLTDKVKSDEKGSGKEVTEYFVVRYPVAEGDGTGIPQDITYATASSSGVRMSSLKRLALILALIILIIDYIIYLYRYAIRTSLNEKRGIFSIFGEMFGVMKTRGLMENVIRLVLIVLVLLAIIGPILPGIRRKTATIFVVDMSDSCMGSLEEEEKYLNDWIAKLPRGEKVGIVTFGRNATTEQFLTDEAAFTQIATNPDGTATNIEEAVKYALALLPDDRTGRIVVLTDGRETIGDINGTLDAVRDAGVELCGKLYEGRTANDVYVQSIDMPDKLATGDAYTIKVTVYSSFETNGVLKIWDGSKLLEEKDVKLIKGENTFLIDGVAGDKTLEQRTITVEATGDLIAENNSVVAAAVVEAPQTVLLISGINEDSAGFEKLLNDINVDATMVSAINAPSSLVEMLQYKTIIIDNCYFTDLPEGFTKNISAYVKDYGGGFVCTGGLESYAPGGYKDTTLEEVLPVDMLPKGVDEAPSMAMVMVIDCSGSMSSFGGEGGQEGRSKLDVAVDAAKEAVDNLGRNDYVGVVAFSDKYNWQQPIIEVEDKESIKETIEGLGIMGGTVIKPAVDAAADGLIDVDAGVKHIILLTDGEGETTDYKDVIDKINENGITLSSVAVGSDSDQKLLKKLAEECGGRYYYSDESSDVPKIFAEEVYLSGDTYYKNGDYALSVSSSNKLVSGLYADGIPNINGYIATTTKSGAREVISTSEDDPLLSSWQYGLGHSVAWMTNAQGTWSEELYGIKDYAEMWKRILDYASMEGSIGQDRVSMYKRRELMEVNYTAADYSEETTVVGVYTTPSGETRDLELLAGDPGNYSGSFIPEEFGVYTVMVARYEGEELVASSTAIETMQFSDEYRQDISNAGFISFIEANGRMLEDNTNIYTRITAKNKSKRDISIYLIIAAVIILLVDITFRRFDLARRIVRKAAGAQRAAEAGRAARKGAGANNKKAQKIKKQGDLSQNNDIIEELESPQVPGAGMAYTGRPEDNTYDAPTEKPGKKHGKGKQKKEEEVPTGLDTSALLKKKKDRNL